MSRTDRGGEPAVSESLRERLFERPTTAADREAATAVLDGETEFLEPQREFEDDLADFFGTEYALCCTNGTAALYSAYFAVGEGDEPRDALAGSEVVCATWNMFSDLGPPLAYGGQLVLCDVDPGTMTIDLDDLEAKVTDDTGVVLVSHLFGETSDLDRLRDLSETYGFDVVEDVSHAWGCEWDGERLGSLFDVGAVSMSGKSLDTPSGGVFLTDEREYYDRAVVLGHYAKLGSIYSKRVESDAFDVPEDHPFARYQNTGLGYKYRMSPVSAAVGRSKLERLEADLAVEQSLTDAFHDRMGDVPHVETVRGEHDPYERVGCYAIAMQLDLEALSTTAEGVVDALATEGIVAWDMTDSQYFSHVEPRWESARYWGEGHHPVTDDLYGRVIAMPGFRGTATGDVDVDAVDACVEAVERVVERYS